MGLSRTTLLQTIKHIRSAGICTTLSIAALLAMPLAAAAADTLPGVVISASRVAEDPARISADVTVLDRAAIDKAQVANVAELLRRQAGINIASTGGAGKTTSLYLRGGNSGHALVLVDGVRVGSATTGAFDWSLMTPEDIERIEIVRGPQSSLYGGDAMSGVIQIFTRKGKEGNHASLHASGASLGTTKSDAAISGATDMIDYALSASRYRTGGVSAVAAGSERDYFRQAQFSGTVGIAVGEGELSLSARRSQGTTGLDGWGVDVLGYTQQNRQSVYSAKLTWPATDHWESSFQIARSSDSSLSRDPATAINNSDFSTRIDQLMWQNTLDIEGATLLFGVDTHRDQGRSSTSGLHHAVRQTAAFASASWSGDMFSLNGAARYDRNSVTVNKSTYRLGAALLPIEGLKFAVNYGTGFKAPSINALYYQDPWGSIGNPNLRPESSRGWDAGIYYDLKAGDFAGGFSAVWFSLRYSDLIQWVPTAPGAWSYTPANVSRALNRGAEFSLHLNYAGAYLNANWTYLLARDSHSGTWLARRAKESGMVLIGYDLAGLNLEAALNMVGPRFSGAGNTLYMRGYRKVDLRARYRFTDHWELTAGVDNAGNKRYEEVSGYGVPARVWHAGAGAEF